jgi:hypothetical protein
MKKAKMVIYIITIVSTSGNKKVANEISNYNFAANINLNFNIIKEKLRGSPTEKKKIDNMANMLKTWFQEGDEDDII